MHCHRLFTIIEQSFKTPHAHIDKGKMWSLTLTYSMVGSIPAPSLQEKERTLFSEHINSLAQLRVSITASVCVCGSFSGQAVRWTAVKCLPVQPRSPEVITPQYRPHQPQHVDTCTHQPPPNTNNYFHTNPNAQSAAEIKADISLDTRRTKPF